MMHFSNVVWSEGMYLGPHHFQAQNRYFEDNIRFAVSSLWFANAGPADSNQKGKAFCSQFTELVSMFQKNFLTAVSCVSDIAR